MRNSGRRKTPSLLRMLAKHRRSSLFASGLLIGLILLGAGLVMFSLPLFGEIDSPSLEDLIWSIFGCAAIASGYFLLVTAIVVELAHEILVRLEDNCRHVHGDEAKAQQEADISEPEEEGSSLHSDSKLEMREISTRDMTVGWRLLVSVPLAVGALLLVFSIVAWQVPQLGNIVWEHGVRLEHLCLGGLMLMMLAAGLMPIGAIGHRRASKRIRISQ